MLLHYVYANRMQKLTCLFQSTENTGVENRRESNMRRWKTQEWNSLEEIAGVENKRGRVMKSQNYSVSFDSHVYYDATSYSYIYRDIK